MSKSLSLRQSAAHLDIPVSTFAGYVKRGIGPKHVRLHGICQFTPADLDAWRSARIVDGAAQ